MKHFIFISILLSVIAFCLLGMSTSATRIAASFPPDQYPAIAAGQGGVTPAQAVAQMCQRFEAGAKRSILGQRVVIAGSLYLAGHILRDHS